MILFFMALACCGIPFLFWKFGASIRARSKYAYAGDDDDAAGAGAGVHDATDEENQVGQEKKEAVGGNGSVPAPPLTAGPAP